MIKEICNKLSEDIHDSFFHNFHLASDELRYNRAFTSIDLIEDSQNAIEEFGSLKVSGIEGRSTLFIYGVLQALFCQQDGLYHLHKSVTGINIKQSDFFEQFIFPKEIREVRNDIAGHPTARKGSEFYFIAKGPNSKSKFTYAGYTPDFRKVDVDLSEFIEQQKEFALRVLKAVENHVETLIFDHKDKFKDKSMVELIKEMGRGSQLIYRGIRDEQRSFQGEWGISSVINMIEKIKDELNLRYNSILPQGIQEPLRLAEYSLTKLSDWNKSGQLLNNDDAEIFLDSLNNQLDELKGMLSEIDDEFQNSKAT